MSSDIEVIQTFLPAFDEKDHPTGNYGIGGVQYFIALVGEEGAVDWDLCTTIYLDEDTVDYGPTAGPITIHHPIPQDHLYKSDDCRFIDGTCWSENTFLNGKSVLDRLKEAGLRGVCLELLEWYNKRLNADYGLGALDVPDWTVEKDMHGFEAMREEAQVA